MAQQHFTEEDSKENIPQHLTTETNLDKIEPVLAAINEAFQTEGAIEGVEVAAGRVYFRKTAPSFDQLAGPRNRSYGSDRDDYYFQIGVRVGYPLAPNIRAKVEDLENVSKAARIAELHKELDESSVIKQQVDAQHANLQAELEKLEGDTA